MFRTRDFLLFLVTASFLLIAIVSTVQSDVSDISYVKLSDYIEQNDSEYTASVPVKDSNPRPERLETLRNKIAEVNLDTYTANLAAAIEKANSVDEDKEESDDENSDENLSESEGIKQCRNYQKNNIAWSPQDLNFAVVEGARIIYRDNNLEGSPSVSSSTVGQSYTSRDVVLQLPVRLLPAGSKKCLNSDVVGIALDGSLIRNNEHTVYGIFGAETQIGYALDGFPIYGLNNEARLDECGGTTENGKYRYYLSSNSEGVIHCYAGTPIRL